MHDVLIISDDSFPPLFGNNFSTVTCFQSANHPTLSFFVQQAQIPGQKFRVCKRTKKPSKNQWFLSDSLAIFNCPGEKERCFFETASLNPADKTECRTMWEDQTALGVLPIVGKLKRGNAILQVIGNECAGVTKSELDSLNAKARDKLIFS